MRILFAIAFVLFAVTARAQERTYTLTVTAVDIATIASALGDVPYSKALPVIEKLKAQIAEQNKPPAAPAPEKKD